jgi:hypothetical protein
MGKKQGDKMGKRKMKRFYLSALFLACLQQPAYAQLLNNHSILNRLPSATNSVTTTTEHLKRKTDQTLEQIKPVVDPLTGTVEKIASPLLKLPKQLPILTTSGETAFVDVRVEHGWRAVQYEWLIMLDESEFELLQKLPIQILEKTHFNELDLTLVRFRVSAELDSRKALKKRLPAELVDRLDRNHIYAAQAEPASASASLIMPKSPANICADQLKIGMVDTAIKKDHPAFKSNGTSSNKIISQDFLDGNFTEPNDHGTAVASLFIGSGDNLQPLVPNAILYSASVFFARNEYAQGATMINLVRALNWLMGQNVSVINMSLAGPDNQILAAVIAKVIASGKAIVAAAGNEGPAAPPMYPAAYPNVIAATAVDREQHIYRWANRGKHIYFSALGVLVLTARSEGGYGRETGTSMATPVVSAFMGCELQQKIGLADALKNLTARTIDLGKKGRDDIFGYGLLDETSKPRH